jgi:hypothetical protein
LHAQSTILLALPKKGAKNKERKRRHKRQAAQLLRIVATCYGVKKEKTKRSFDGIYFDRPPLVAKVAIEPNRMHASWPASEPRAN